MSNMNKGNTQTNTFHSLTQYGVPEGPLMPLASTIYQVSFTLKEKSSIAYVNTYIYISINIKFQPSTSSQRSISEIYNHVL
jgi:hypothetical protein